MLDRPVAVHDRVGAEVDRGIEELLDQRAERVGLREPRKLVAELELVEDVLDVWREAVEIGLEVGLELLLARAGAEVAQGELRRVVEGLPGGLPKRRVLVRDPRLVERWPSSRGRPCLVGSSTASSRRRTVIGRITSRYLPRT